jgi:hypothetical protein
MFRFAPLLLLGLLAACSAPTPAQQTDAIVIGANAVPCVLHAIAAASKADTLANAEAIALVLASDPACTALEGPTLDLIRSGVAAGKTAIKPQ